jgi:hypothetical protein
VQAEKAGRGHKCDREAQDAGVSAPRGRLARQERERTREDPCDEDEPEMSRLVLPVDVELRPGEQEREAGDRRDEER